MEKRRQIKILSIVALVLAIISMTMGFAAFSTTLKISSSATVTPNLDSFKITIYGIDDEIEQQDFIDNPIDPLLYTSLTQGMYIFDGEWNDSNPALEATPAIIDNSTHTISNLSFTFSEPSQGGVYPFLIKNEGKYKAYLDAQEIENYIQGIAPNSCEPQETTTNALVQKACSSIELYITLVNSQGEAYESGDYNIELDTNDYLVFVVSIAYISPGDMADGPFSASFQNLELNFTTAN